MIFQICFLLAFVKALVVEDSVIESRFRIKPFHRVYSVDFAASVPVKIPSQLAGVTLNANISSLPIFGFVYQVSQVYDTHGYLPVFERSNERSLIRHEETAIYSKNNVVVYALPEEHEYHLHPGYLAYGNFAYYGRIQYTLRFDEKSVRRNTFAIREQGISPKFLKQQNSIGQIIFVNTEKIFFRSLFTFSNEKWQVVSNDLCNGDQAFVDYYVSDRRGESFVEPFEVYDDDKYFEYDTKEYNYDGIVKVLPGHHVFKSSCADPRIARIGHENSQLMGLSRFVYGSEYEKSFNVEKQCESESARWYFKAPKKYHDDWSVMYGGTIEFTLGTLGGDFANTQEYNADLNVIILECQYCERHTDRLAYRIQPSQNHAIMKSFLESDFSTFRVNITLSEADENWIVYPHNPIQPIRRPTRCEFVNFLGGVSGFFILGDYLSAYETIGLDEVVVRIGLTGDQSGPPEECYCKVPGVYCGTDHGLYFQ